MIFCDVRKNSVYTCKVLSLVPFMYFTIDFITKVKIIDNQSVFRETKPCHSKIKTRLMLVYIK